VRILTDAARLGCINNSLKQGLIAAYIEYRSRYHVLSLDQQGRCVSREELEEHINLVVKAWQDIFGLNN